MELPKFHNVLELMRTFDTEDKCKDYLISLRWGNNIVCPHCEKSDKVYRFANKYLYKCSCCKKQFSPITKTIFQGTHIDLRNWFYAIYIFVNHRKGLSSVQLSKDLRITQKSAWLMLHKIRLSMKDRKGKFSGEIEVDETYVGGKNKNRHYNKKVKHSQGRSTKDKVAVFGFVEKNGRVRTMQIGKLHWKGMKVMLSHCVDKSSTIYSDEYGAYRGLDKRFKKHEIVNHAAYQYVNGNATTNTMECFWSLLKRGIIGIYHKVSRKLLHRYLPEFEFRWNTRKETSLERFMLTINQGFGRTLTLKELTNNFRR